MSLIFQLEKNGQVKNTFNLLNLPAKYHPSFLPTSYKRTVIIWFVDNSKLKLLGFSKKV
jgi:hypothetical protein